MLKTVVSVGCTRLFGGMGLGAGRPVRFAIVVGVVDERLMRLASGSVPVLTDHRSTPQVAAATGDANGKPRDSNVRVVESERTTHGRTLWIRPGPRKAVDELLLANAHRRVIGG